MISFLLAVPLFVPVLMQEEGPPPPAPEVVEPAIPEAVLIRERCSGCHTLERVQNYRLDHWDAIVKEMQAYGLKLSREEAATIAGYLRSGEPY